MVTSNPSRVVSIESGIVMVVSDLHGDWSLYQRYRDVFLGLRTQGMAHTLVFTGDVIHYEGPPENDRSAEIVLDLLALRSELGESPVLLLGNHEFAHIYPFVLARGQHLYTPAFEHAMGLYREAIVTFLDTLPFFARTRAGVSLCHAGAFPQVHDPEAMATLLDFSHRALLEAAEARVTPEQRPVLRSVFDATQMIPYDQQMRDYFAVSGPDDPRYYDYLISQIAMQRPEFDMLWEVLFNRNEQEYGDVAYARHLQGLLHALSVDYAPQRVLVTGHMRCSNGYRVLAERQQLRLASGPHARPMHKARYLLFDAERPVNSADDLLEGIGCVFEA